MPIKKAKVSKIKSIIVCSNFFMNENSIDKEVRFDIITVLPDEKGVLQINHIEDAFQSFDAN